MRMRSEQVGRFAGENDHAAWDTPVTASVPMSPSLMPWQEFPRNYLAARHRVDSDLRSLRERSIALLVALRSFLEHYVLAFRPVVPPDTGAHWPKMRSGRSTGSGSAMLVPSVAAMPQYSSEQASLTLREADRTRLVEKKVLMRHSRGSGRDIVFSRTLLAI